MMINTFAQISTLLYCSLVGIAPVYLADKFYE